MDGHNLAHHLFLLTAGQRLDSSIAGRLISMLSTYRDQFAAPRPDFEVCFDGGVRPDIPDPPGIRVLAAGHQNKADYLVVDRFRTHAYFGHACLVISNDEEILTRVKAEGGATLRVFDFVRKQHPDWPDFQPAEVIDNLIPSHTRITKLSIPDSESILHRVRPIKPARDKPKTTKVAIQILADPPQTPLTIAEPEIQNPIHLPRSEIKYRITILDWPIPDGVQFLMDSFCEKHRPEFINLLDSFDPDMLRPADLQVLAEFLVAECSAEAGFCTHGSLMSRVRLALLIAGENGLSLSQLAHVTRLKPLGLQGRLRRKSKGWLEGFFQVEYIIF